MPIDEYIERAREGVERLFATPIADWESRQWLLAAALVMLGLWCCGCLCGGRRQRYYRRGRGGDGFFRSEPPGATMNGGGTSYYPTQQRSSGGGMCGCLQNIVLAVCCFEFCCRDCQDVNKAILGADNNGYSLRTGDGGEIV